MQTFIGTPHNPAQESAGQEMDLSVRLKTIDPALDLEAEILRLKDEMNAVILAHYYQDDVLQDLADHVGIRSRSRKPPPRRMPM
jgi:quinolinate synthase